jgi:hypothetical protein
MRWRGNRSPSRTTFFAQGNVGTRTVRQQRYQAKSHCSSGRAAASEWRVPPKLIGRIAPTAPRASICAAYSAFRSSNTLRHCCRPGSPQKSTVSGAKYARRVPKNACFEGNRNLVSINALQKPDSIILDASYHMLLHQKQRDPCQKTKRPLADQRTALTGKLKSRWNVAPQQRNRWF